jgi:hypothetical protein
MPRPPAPDRDERVSLAGPDPAEVLKALLKVERDDEPSQESTDGEADRA